MDEGDRVVSAGGQLAAHGFRVDRLAPLEFEGGGLLAAAERDVVPFVRKGAVHAAKHLFFDEIADRALH